MNSPLFVWVRGLKGPTPEKWPEMLVDMNGSPVPTLVSHELTEAEYWLSFHQLVKKYPAPEMEKIKRDCETTNSEYRGPPCN